jgi:hypothetical protein
MAKETVIVEGTMYWNNCTTENQFAPGKHSFDLSNLSDAAIAKIASLGSSTGPRTKEGQEDRGQFITLKQSMKIGHMKFNDESGSQMEKEEIARIGNGSKVRVKVGAYTNSFGTWLSYEGGRVLELIEYTPDDGLGDDGSDFSDLSDDSPFTTEQV